MNFFTLPTKPPTPSEYRVLIAFVAASFIIFGIAGLMWGVALPPERHEVALPAFHYGWRCVGLGVSILVAWWLVRRIVD